MPGEPSIPVCARALLQGKLRMLYECFPMAMLMEQAGGKATSGTQRIMDIVPDSIHGRWVPQQPLGSHWAATGQARPCWECMAGLLLYVYRRRPQLRSGPFPASRCPFLSTLCRAPIYLGSKEEVELFEMFKEADAEAEAAK